MKDLNVIIYMHACPAHLKGSARAHPLALEPAGVSADIAAAGRGEVEAASPPTRPASEWQAAPTPAKHGAAEPPCSQHHIHKKII